MQPKQQASWHSKHFYCPNCRHLIDGFEGKDGVTRMICDNCRSVIICKAMGRRHDRIDVYAPRDQEKAPNN